MIIRCTKCQVKFRFDEARLTDGPKKVRCTKCGEVFTVLPPGAAEALPELPQAPATPSHIPTGHTLARHPTGEQPRQPAAAPGKRPLAPTTPAPRVTPAASRPADTLRPSFMTLTGITAQPEGDPVSAGPATRPPAPAAPPGLQRPVFMTLTGITAQSGDEPGAPPASPTAVPRPISAPSTATILSTTARGPAPDPTRLERPAEPQQVGINQELYKQSDLKLELPPLVKALREVDFDAPAEAPAKDDVLELDMGREFEYGGDGSRTSTRKPPSVQVRAPSGIRDDSIPARTDYSRLSSALVKLLLMGLIVATLLVLLLVIGKGDTFNLSRLTSLSGLSAFVSDLLGLSSSAPPSPL